MERGILSTVIIVILVGAAVLLGLYFLFGGSSDSDEEGTGEEDYAGPKVEMSGVIKYNGLKPKEDSIATVTILYREHGALEYMSTGLSAEAEDNAEWVWKEAIPGVVYDMKAVLTIDDMQISDTNEITASAPASNEVLVFNVTVDDIPDSILANNPVPLSGFDDINGYIPPGSYITVEVRAAGETVFEEVVRTPATGSRTQWQWDEAIAGTHYEIQSYAYDANDQPFAVSIVGERTAPASGIQFIMGSHAVPPEGSTGAPATSSALSGKVKINGIFEDGSGVDIHARPTGTGEAYKTVASVEAVNGVAWSWDGAKTGVKYDVQARLDQPTESDVDGKTVVVAAPAENVLLVLDTHHRYDQPANAPVLAGCENSNDNDEEAEATLRYKDVEGAEKYWLTVGSHEGDADLYNNAVSAPSNNDDPEVSVDVVRGDSYYSQYSYTECGDCSGTGSYSEFSDTLKFTCD